MDNVTRNNLKRNTEAHDNADPIVGEPERHSIGTPVGTVLGGGGGVIAGAVLGSIGGPLGMLIGGAVGAVIGGVAGSSAGGMLDPKAEYDYWQENHTTRPYYNSDYDYEIDYHPAYTVGYASRVKHPKTAHFEDVESELEQRWNEVKGESRMDWLQAKDMVRDGWDKTSARMQGETYQPHSYANYAVHSRNIDKDKPHPIATGTSAPAFEGNMEEDSYWRTQHVTTDYYNPQYDYDTDYQRAYGYGYEQRKRYDSDQSFDVIESDLQQDWNNVRGDSRLTWAEAKYAVRDAWNRPMR